MKKSNHSTICLNMIVKNESHVIIKTFDNILSNINLDYWVISDTGSTDNTKELIIDYFKKKKIPGELVEHKWEDFGYNRTKALECAYNKTDYLFIFDADDSIIGKFNLPKIITCDKYDFKFGGGCNYIRPLIVNNRKKWKWVGVLHEYLSCDDIQSSLLLDGDYFIESGKTGDRSKDPDKYYKDAIILKKAFEKEFEPNYGLACRYAFYCAQSFRDAGPKYIDDSLEWYLKCIELENWSQEKFFSCMMIGNFYEQKKDLNNAYKYWIKSIEYDGERMDGIIQASIKMMENGHYLLVNLLYNRFKDYNKNLKDKLFLLDYFYNGIFEFNNSIAAYYSNDSLSGYECCKKVLHERTLSYNHLKRSLENLNFYKKIMETDDNNIELFYDVNKLFQDIQRNNDFLENKQIEIWNLLYNKNKNKLTKFKKYVFKNKEKPSVFISFTTCKRFDLFTKTMNSILNHWLDIDKIDYWFCVDDNSSETDRINMKKLYNWIEYYYKTPEEKGHLKSMNIIWNKLSILKPTYWIHMEDDFLFIDKMNYVSESIRGLELLKNENVNQILFNNNYGETIDNYNFRGHIYSHYGFAVHDYKLGDFPYINCHYWPHYSFRPSLVKVESILKLGNYDTEIQFFEMEYANKWNKAGYKSAFFDKITNIHIGRLTSERNDPTKLNAYKLNSEEQFLNVSINEEDKKINTNENEKKNINIVTKDNFDMNNSNAKIKIINLEKRKDRKNKTIEIFTEVGIDRNEYQFIKGIDGNKLVSTPMLKKLFKGNDFGSRRGFIGCALSHYYLWKKLLDDTENEYYIIMEDDITLSNNFKISLEKLKDELKNKDMLFLGYHMFDRYRAEFNDLYNRDDDNYMLEPINLNIYIGGFFAYSINKCGAKKMIDYIEKNGIMHGIDYLIKIVSELSAFELQPQIIFSIWNENMRLIDTNIQADFNFLDFDNDNLDDNIDNSCEDENEIYINKLNFTCNSENAIDIQNNENDFEYVEENNIKEKFIFIPNLDSPDKDLFFKNNISIEESMKIADNDISCAGFNTLGFFKSFIDIKKLKRSTYFSLTDGVYVKKSILEDPSYHLNNKSYRVKMICDWCSSEQLCKEWSDMCENEYIWKNIVITWEDNDIDYYVIVNKSLRGEYYNPKKTILFQMEPWIYNETCNWGVRTWGEWSIPDEKHFLSVIGRKTNSYNNAFWQLGLKLPELLDFHYKKIDKISSICSSKYYDPGHILRIDLLRFIESKNDFEIDIYNEDNKFEFKGYKGVVTPHKDKYNGMVNYKYYFMIENNFEENFITEKLWEPILCESLVFYYGCPNVSTYINPLAYVELDVNDFEKCYQTMKRAIEEDWWSQRIDIIREEKKKILNEMAFFPRIEKIIKDNEKK